MQSGKTYTTSGTSTVRIGVPKEIKNREHRVAMIPEGAAALVASGHDVFVEVGPV